MAPILQCDNATTAASGGGGGGGGVAPTPTSGVPGKANGAGQVSGVLAAIASLVAGVLVA